MFKIGEKVHHRTRPDVGVGKLVALLDNGSCTVDFPTCRFTGIPLHVIGTVEQIEIERREAEARLKKQQAEIRKRVRLDREQAQQDEKRREHEIVQQQILAAFAKYDVRVFWHMTHKKNVSNILKHGILNHHGSRKFIDIDISNPDIQKRREKKDPIYGHKIHDYSSLYINPINPMFYVLSDEKPDLCLIEVMTSVLAEHKFLFSDGNAAARNTLFYNSLDDINLLPWNIIKAFSRCDDFDAKRKRCAEVLIYPKIPPRFIANIYCFSGSTLDYLRDCGRNVSFFSSKLVF
ncbi:MAG: DarT ssDNA thymidine ADP-ribosyltransferase family protein [Bacteroidales bacterium]